MSGLIALARTAQSIANDAVRGSFGFSWPAGPSAIAAERNTSATPAVASEALKPSTISESRLDMTLLLRQLQIRHDRCVWTRDDREWRHVAGDNSASADDGTPADTNPFED